MTGSDPAKEPLRIGITIERTEPLLGTVGLSDDVAGSSIPHPVHFEGWLALLSLLAGMTATPRKEA